MVEYWMNHVTNKIFQHTDIADEDEEKIFMYSDQSRPIKFQQEVWYSITKYYVSRGRVGIRRLTKPRTGSDGKCFYEMSHLNQTKTTKQSLKTKD